MHFEDEHIYQINKIFNILNKMHPCSAPCTLHKQNNYTYKKEVVIFVVCLRFYSFSWSHLIECSVKPKKNIHT